MLFGNNPWGNRLASPLMQAQQAPQQQQAQPMQPQYAAPTWLGQTPDGTYGGGLANYYASQVQNQMVPGSLPQPMQPQAFPAQQQQMTQQQPFAGGWRDAFHNALQAWRGQRPDSGFAQWRQARPSRQDYRQGVM